MLQSDLENLRSQFRRPTDSPDLVRILDHSQVLKGLAGVFPAGFDVYRPSQGGEIVRAKVPAFVAYRGRLLASQPLACVL